MYKGRFLVLLLFNKYFKDFFNLKVLERLISQFLGPKQITFAYFFRPPSILLFAEAKFLLNCFDLQQIIFLYHALLNTN